MKKFLAVLVMFLMFTTSNIFANVNEQVLYSFRKAFPAAVDAKWSEDANGYLVSFTQYGILSKVAYNVDGDFMYALRYYGKENLPVSILMAVKKRFKDKNIFSVTEVSTPDGVEYHLKLDDAKNFYGILVSSYGSITVEEKFKKINS